MRSNQSLFSTVFSGVVFKIIVVLDFLMQINILN